MDDMITINELIWKLKKCIRPAYELLCQIGYDEHLELYDLVEKDETDPNTNYKVKAVDEILLNLYKAHDSLRFLQGREGREVYKVTRMPGKRYGYQDKDGRQVDFHCGHCLEALVTDEEGRMYWAPTCIEHDSERFYLVGYADIPLEGLLIRDGQ